MAAQTTIVVVQQRVGADRVALDVTIKTLAYAVIAAGAALAHAPASAAVAPVVLCVDALALAA